MDEHVEEISCIKDGVTGVCRDLKDKKAREDIAEVTDKVNEVIETVNTLAGIDGGHLATDEDIEELTNILTTLEGAVEEMQASLDETPELPDLTNYVQYDSNGNLSLIDKQLITSHIKLNGRWLEPVGAGYKLYIAPGFINFTSSTGQGLYDFKRVLSVNTGEQISVMFSKDSSAIGNELCYLCSSDYTSGSTSYIKGHIYYCNYVNGVKTITDLTTGLNESQSTIVHEKESISVSFTAENFISTSDTISFQGFTKGKGVSGQGTSLASFLYPKRSRTGTFFAKINGELVPLICETVGLVPYFKGIFYYKQTTRCGIAIAPYTTSGADIYIGTNESGASISVKIEELVYIGGA